MERGKYIRRLALHQVGWWLMLPLPAIAAQPDAPVRWYAIEAGSLDAALRTFTLSNGMLLSADGALTLGRLSAGLQGRFADEEALHRLLAGTGLQAMRQPDGSFILRAAPASAEKPAPQLVQRMPQVHVEAGPADTYLQQSSRIASKFDASLRDTPQAVTVVTGQQMRDRSIRSMEELLQYVPGIEASQGEGNRDNAVFRGYNSNADFYLDGIRDDVQYFRDFYNIERVEAVKGPNAAVFGRGGAGGIVNRVRKQAGWSPIAEATASAGSWSGRRYSIDVGQPVAREAAVRINAVYETAGSFRDGVGLERKGMNASAAYRLAGSTLLTAGAEYFNDRRTTDRGIPSFHGRPVAAAPSTFFGDPAQSPNWVTIHAANLGLEHSFAGGAQLRQQIQLADYDKYYQNVFSGAVDASGETVRMLGYTSATRRRNMFSQTDIGWTANEGGRHHQLAAGIELGRQLTDNFRTTGYFDSLGADIRYVTVPVAHPFLSVPVSFRQSATDIDNHGTARSLAAYLQDQVQLSPAWQAVLGLRYDRFSVSFADRRGPGLLRSRDQPFSPRAGLIYRPTEGLSLYASYSEAFGPRAGDQLASLTPGNEALRPEAMRNAEAGAKWDIAPELAATVALYDLRRRNVAVADPADASRSLLVDGQRSQGLEASLTGRVSPGWNIVMAYAWQLPRITDTQSASAQAGARMPHVPRHSFSLWSKYEWTQALAASLGLVSRSMVFSSTSNAVRLPGFARLDGALFYRAGTRLEWQLNVENLLNRRYFKSAFSDNNISPGTPRSARLTVTARF